MSGIKSLIVLVLLAIAGLVLVQNQTPISVILLGVASPMLPLGLWAIIAAVIGSFLMLIVALLISLGGSRHSRSPRSPRSSVIASNIPPTPNDPRDPDPSAPRRPFGVSPKPPIGDNEDNIDETGNTEVWDNDEAWDDRDREVPEVSQFVPNLEPPREPWEQLGDEMPSTASPKAPHDLTDRPLSEEFEVTGDPLDLPPTSEYELDQQPVEVYRQGSVYSFSYATNDEPPVADTREDPSNVENTSNIPTNTPTNTPAASTPLNLGNPSIATGNANSDRRVPIDLPTRDSATRPDLANPLDPLDDLEEITPIVEPTDPIEHPERPERSPTNRRPNAPSEQRDRGDRAPSVPLRQNASQNTASSRRNPPATGSDAAPNDSNDRWDRDWREPARDDSDWI